MGHFCVSLFPLFSVYAAALGDYNAACLAAALGVGDVGGVGATIAPATMSEGIRGMRRGRGEVAGERSFH